MNVQKMSSANVSFGIKVPTKDVIDLVSGINSKETTNVMLKLSGISKEKMLMTMGSDKIEFSQNYCKKQIIKSEPKLSKLAQIKEDLAQLIQKSFRGENEGTSDKLTALFDAKETEITNLLKTMPEEIDVPSVKLPF